MRLLVAYRAHCFGLVGVLRILKLTGSVVLLLLYPLDIFVILSEDGEVRAFVPGRVGGRGRADHDSFNIV